MIRTTSSCNFTTRIMGKNTSHSRLIMLRSSNKEDEEEKQKPYTIHIDNLMKSPLIKKKKFKILQEESKSMFRSSLHCPFASSIGCIGGIGKKKEMSSPIMKDKKRFSIKTLQEPYYNYQEGFSSRKAFKIIRSYAYNSFEGITDKINEDRIIIDMQITAPPSFKGLKWPKVHFFGIYDGHGGIGCANFLKENLHNYIISNKYFPIDIQKAISKGFKNAEKEFIKQCLYREARDNEILDDSGSCALIALIVDDKAFVANVGDSRAVLSLENGKKWRDVTIDHKPNERYEMERILKNKGKIIDQYGNVLSSEYQYNKYSSSTLLPKIQINSNQVLDENKIYRVQPGGLAVSRTIGDIKAKLSQYGGIPNAISAVPDIFFLNHIGADFLVLGCDGIFDVLKSREVVDIVWEGINQLNGSTLHSQSLRCVNLIIKSALAKESLDNVSCILISFENFGKYFFQNNIKKKSLMRSNSHRDQIQFGY